MIPLNTGHIRLNATELLSKWGFNDGDQPEDYFDWLLGRRGLDADYDNEIWRLTLIRIVREHLLPVLAPYNVEVYEIDTIHNPIRADSVNGISVNVHDTENGKHFPTAFLHECVDVPFETVLKTYETIQRGG